MSAYGPTCAFQHLNTLAAIEPNGKLPKNFNHISVRSFILSAAPTNALSAGSATMAASSSPRRPKTNLRGPSDAIEGFHPLDLPQRVGGSCFFAR